MFEKLFNTGLGVSVLPKIIELLHERISRETTLNHEWIEKIANVLIQCGKSSQFGIGVDCLTDLEKEIATNLNSKLKQSFDYYIGDRKEVKSEFEHFCDRYF